MALKLALNPITGQFDLVQNLTGYIKFYISATQPSNPSDGMIWINTSSGNLYIYYGSDWQILSVLTNNVIPTTAILDELDDPILDEAGDFILAEA